MKKAEPEIVVIRLQLDVVKTILHEATFGIVLSNIFASVRQR